MSHIQTAPGRCLIASIALLAATACGDSSGPGASDDRGVLLATNVVGPTDLVWTKDGGEVVYAVPTALNAVSVATQVERHLVSDLSISIRGIGSAGDRIYYAAVVTPPAPAAAYFRVSRINPTTGAVEILPTGTWRGGGEYVFVSADERFLVTDGRVYDLAAGTQIDLACNRPRAFSPDATQILCQTPFGSGSQAPFALISTADGTIQQLPSTTAVGFYFGLRWEGNSPQLLNYVFDNGMTRIYEIDGVTGVSRDVSKLDGNVTLLLLASWSRDGRTLGAWIQPKGANRPANLYVIHSGGAPAIAASASSSFLYGPGTPAFSASGNSVAYFYYNENNTRSLYAKTGL
jgi:hypothetical protein